MNNVVLCTPDGPKFEEEMPKCLFIIDEATGVEEPIDMTKWANKPMIAIERTSSLMIADDTAIREMFEKYSNNLERWITYAPNDCDTPIIVGG